ncbi:MAG: nucleoside monophosphate kinase [Alphaproteobacteria bacterium]|nr:nucleoside monophosphate kinase [Alphaproteobacteria bacterium]
MILVFFGAPGSGKGTQAHELKKAIKTLSHISTGDLLRQEITSDSAFGRSIKYKIDAGEFITDDIILQLVTDILRKKSKKDIIFDGFPRTLNQAIAFDALLGVENLKVDVVFDFDIDVHELIERISGRYVCQDCGAVYHKKNRKPRIDSVCDQCGGTRFIRRQDDTAQALETRLKIYREQTLPVRDYYKDKGVLKKINASQTAAIVTENIKETLRSAGLMKEGE